MYTRYYYRSFIDSQFDKTHSTICFGCSICYQIEPPGHTPPALLFLSFTMTNSGELFGSDKRQTVLCSVPLSGCRLEAPIALEFPWGRWRLTVAPQALSERLIGRGFEKSQQGFLKMLRFFITYWNCVFIFVSGRRIWRCLKSKTGGFLTRGTKNWWFFVAVSSKLQGEMPISTSYPPLPLWINLNCPPLWLTKWKVMHAKLGCL